MVEWLERMIDTVSVQNLFAPLCCVLEKDTFNAVLNFRYISTKLKNQNKKFPAHNNTLSTPQAGQGNFLLDV